jgi:hypothetical protein
MYSTNTCTNWTKKNRTCACHNFCSYYIYIFDIAILDSHKKVSQIYSHRWTAPSRILYMLNSEKLNFMNEHAIIKRFLRLLLLSRCTKESSMLPVFAQTCVIETK